MVYDKVIKVIIDAPDLAEIIIEAVVYYYGLPNSIMSDCGSVFTLKFWFSLCYFLEIKQKLSIALYPKIKGKTKKQNSTMKVYFRAFVYYKQDN